MDLAAGWVQVVAFFFSELDNNAIRFLKTSSGPVARNSEHIYYMLFCYLFFIVSIFLSVIQSRSCRFWQWQMVLCLCSSEKKLESK